MIPSTTPGFSEEARSRVDVRGPIADTAFVMPGAVYSENVEPLLGDKSADGRYTAVVASWEGAANTLDETALDVVSGL
ncbi:hypothetical protein OIU34_38090 [Pararhizobium sp. BT-229]|nr:hypothetical protein [Pararhizobium sp. BT-229]MCV9967638.1 hypothetical protein [Pararhizobium sp. BT-229]